MNNSFLKYLSIFLILLFCLSPLGAIDLGQGDNSSQINNNGTDLKDLNDTVIDDDRDIKSDNGTDDIKAIDNDVEFQRVSVNDSNSLKLQGHDPKLSMEVEDCVYGESPIIKIYFKDKYFGFTNKQQTVIIQGGGFYESYSYTFGKGCNIVKLRNDMPAGTYSVTYHFWGSTWYDDKTVMGKLTIRKCAAGIKCHVNDVECDQAPLIITQCDEHLANETIVTSPQLSKVYKLNPSQINNTIVMYGNLLPGNYTCNVFYPGDSNHNSQNTTLTFNVKKINPNLTVKVDDIPKGGDLNVEVHAKTSINGNVTCSVLPEISSDLSASSKHYSQTINLVNGVGNGTIDCSGLSPGRYMVCTIFKGNDTVSNDIVSQKFQVKEPL